MRDEGTAPSPGAGLCLPVQRLGQVLGHLELDGEVAVARLDPVLPALGAITAGPAGAAVGAVAQAVLNAPMKQMNRTLYSVEGGWDAPKIEVIDRGPERLESTASDRGSPVDP